MSGRLSDSGHGKPVTNIFSAQKLNNEDKQTPRGWTKPVGGIGGWSKELPGARPMLSAKAERKRAREEEATAAAAAAPPPGKKLKAKDAAIAAAAPPPGKKAKAKDAAPFAATAAAVGAARASLLAEQLGELAGGGEATASETATQETAQETARIVSLVQPESVRAADGRFAKGHMASLKATLEAAGEIEYLSLVADSLELHVVYADAS